MRNRHAHATLTLLAAAALLLCAATAGATTRHRSSKSSCRTGHHRGCRRRARPNAPGTCAAANAVPTAATLAAADSATLCLINQQRAHYGLRALRANANLGHMATGHSESMVAEDYFDHTSPDGQTLLDRVFASGYAGPSSDYQVSENIGFGTDSLATPAAMVSAWMNSPPHRANILYAAYQDSGVGIAIGVPESFGGTDPGATYTEDFGTVNGH